MLFPRKGLIALAVIVVIPAAMVLVRALVVRGRTELSSTSVPDAAALVPSPSEALEASREVQLGLELPVPGGTEASPPIDPGEPSQREPA